MFAYCEITLILGSEIFILIHLASHLSSGRARRDRDGKYSIVCIFNNIVHIEAWLLSVNRYLLIPFQFHGWVRIQ